MARLFLGRSLGSLPITLWLVFFGGLLPFSGLRAARAQTPSATSQTPPSSTSQEAPKPDASLPSDEVISHDTPTTFKVRVNVVLVRVVVRDASGKVITNLKKEDFQLEDNRKRQTISSFSAEAPASESSTVKLGTAEATPEETAPVKVPQLPKRFVALFFDDLHLSMADAMQSKLAATKLLGSMQASDRFAIFTTSGQVALDFIADRAELEATIQRIMPHPETSASDCPPMSLYEAYQIQDANDSFALSVAIQDVMNCARVTREQAEQLARSAAQRELALGEFQVRQAFQNMSELIRRMSAAPGQRTIVLMSPGFFVVPSAQQESGEMIDRATKANVVINTIDARGMYASSMYQASSNAQQSAQKTRLVQTEESLLNEVLGEIADGTGGLFFHNRNDIDQGLLQAAAVPEVSYVLGFMPQNLKLDGKYHHLKVTLVNQQKWALQARHGYFAPHGEADSEATAKEEIQQAVFSQAEMQDFPLQCQTQFFRGADGVHLTVLARIETNTLKFRKDQDHNDDNLTVVTAVFDENGNLLDGQQRVIEMKLKDATRERLNKEGLKVKSSFDLKPGSYLVRIVVRDSEGAQMAALNRGVVIP